MSEHSTEAVLDRILHEAREITGARYAALGVLDESRSELERFITLGIDEATHRAIGELPHGRGVLGVLIHDPRPLRLPDVGEHPHSYGFPVGHPPMHSFLGVPIVIRGEGWGNLYLAEKVGADEFSADDEEAAMALAQWAATAIDNARLHESGERRREQLEQAVRSLQAARDIADAISGTSDLERVLELIVKRGRALIDAQSVVIMLREHNELVVTASAGLAVGALGHRLPISRSTSGQVLERGRAERITDVGTRLRIAPKELGVPDARFALLVPMLHHGAGIGVLAAFDRGADPQEFTADDEELLRTFAASAANAVAINQSIQAERLRSTIAAADAERSRWARELHDETLQSLGSPAGAARFECRSRGLRDQGRSHAPGGRGHRARDRQPQGDHQRSTAHAAGRSRAATGARGVARSQARRWTGDRRGLALPDATAGADSLTPGLKTTIYRLVQEALTNVVKHAEATTPASSSAWRMTARSSRCKTTGRGFHPAVQASGFGLAGMRERVYLAGGEMQVEPSESGTTMRAQLPTGAALRRPGSAADQAAS